MAGTDEEVRLTQADADSIKTEGEKAVEEITGTYDDMISDSDKYFQDQIKATEDWGKKQTNIQNQQTDFAIQKIEQQKEWAEKDYKKEQSGAYKDWQKQSNPFGVTAEQMAAQGMANTGYAESSQVAMYNQYQNRVATARESFIRAKTEYDNAMTEARLQNSAVLAQIAAETLQKKLELSLQGFQYKNQLITEKTTAIRQTEIDYWGRYKDVLNQILTQESIDETKRHNQAAEAATNRSISLQERQFEWQKAQAGGSSGGGGGSGGRVGGSINKTTMHTKDGNGTAKLKNDKKPSKESFAVDSSINTYDKAVDLMKIYGVPNSYASNVKTYTEWTHRKEGYSSYQAYLKDYVSYACTELAE